MNLFVVNEYGVFFVNRLLYNNKRPKGEPHIILTEEMFKNQYHTSVLLELALMVG
jgi:hypothetical protein